jgi:hypothetical protein
MLNVFFIIVCSNIQPLPLVTDPPELKKMKERKNASGYATLKPILLIVTVLLISFQVAAQRKISPGDFDFAEPDRQGRFFLIPEASLWFGTYTNISFAPQVGFHPLDRLSIGAGPHYIFYQNNDFYSPVNFSSHIWGVKGFSRLSVIRNAAEMLPFYLFDELFAHVEYELMNLENRYFNAPAFPPEGRFWAEYLYVGFGISQKLQGFSSYSVMLLWNLNNTLISLYRNPTYRVGFMVYL